MRVAQGLLLADPTVSRLPPDSLQMLISDHFLGRQHIALFLNQKLAYWKQLPYCLAGLGHLNVAVARRSARRALVLFDLAPAGYLHHPLSVLMCSPVGQGRVEMLEFLNGQARDTLPIVFGVGARWRFTPVTERWWRQNTQS